MNKITHAVRRVQSGRVSRVRTSGPKTSNLPLVWISAMMEILPRDEKTFLRLYRLVRLILVFLLLVLVVLLLALGVLAAVVVSRPELVQLLFEAGH